MRLRNLIPCKAKLIIYKSSILPHLTYCHLVWHNCRSSDSRKIKRIQERARIIRAVINSHSESYENLLVRAELPSLLNRRLQDIAILMYKVKYGLAPSIVNELFKRKSTSYSLRNSDFDIPTFNTIIKLWPPTQAFLGELVFRTSPQTPAQPKTTFLSQA